MNQEEFNDMQLKKLSDVRREYAAFEFDYFQDFVDWVYL